MSLQRHSAAHKASGAGLLPTTQLCPSMEWDLCYCTSSSSDILKNLSRLKTARTDNTYTWSGDTWSFSSISRAGGSTPGTQNTLSSDSGVPLQSTMFQAMQLDPVNLAGISAFNGEGEVLGAVREEKTALHFCEGDEGYITFSVLPLPSPVCISLTFEDPACSKRVGADTTPETLPMTASFPSTSQMLLTSLYILLLGSLHR